MSVSIPGTKSAPSSIQFRVPKGPPISTSNPLQPSWLGGLSHFNFCSSLCLLLALASLLPAADQPHGASLIERCIAAEGGAKAIERAQTAIMTGSVEITGHNISGPLEIYQDGDKAYTEIQLPGIGKVEEGFDGQVAWESNVLQGPRVKEGEELEAAKRACAVCPRQLEDYYKSAVTTGEEDVNGKPAWKVDMTPLEGNAAEHFYFDRTSGLLVKMTQTLPTALGDIPVEMIIGDYREVDGIQTPFLMTQSAMGQNMELHMTRLPTTPASHQENSMLPPDVKALAAKKKQP